VFFDHTAIGPTEADAVVIGPLNAEPAFMHQSMVMAAEQNKIVDRGVTAIRPVLNVMRIDKAAMVAARETAADVTRLQGAA
jgi:hypothetical protein